MSKILKKPRNVDVDESFVSECEKKLENAMFNLAKSPRNGGNPFLYWFAATMEHELANIPTAGTNGKKIFWGVDYIKKLSAKELRIELMHELMHVVLAHTSKKKKLPTISNVQQFIEESQKHHLMGIAMDVVVDSNIQKTFDDAGYGGNHWTHLSPMTFAELKRGEDVPNNFCFPDTSVVHMTHQEIYNELVNSNFNKKHSRDCHMQMQTDEEQIKQKIMMAAQMVSSGNGKGRGSVPGFVEEYLEELKNPTLDLKTFVRNVHFRKSQQSGLENDHNRFKRRYIVNELYYPKKIATKTKVAILLDTSGSMSQQDMTTCISQVLSLTGEAVIIPNDTEPHWKDVTTVNDINAFNLNKIKCTGRKGTSLQQFFDEYPKHIGIDFDALIVCTDGDIDDISHKLKFPVLWVIVGNDDFVAPFGNVVKLSVHD